MCYNEPKGFVGPEGYKQLADAGVCDVVHINTSWVSHTDSPPGARSSRFPSAAYVPVRNHRIFRTTRAADGRPPSPSATCPSPPVTCEEVEEWELAKFATTLGSLAF